jgi:copper chaperone CopZ
MARKIYQVTGMHCPNCAMNLEALEDKIPGIQMIFASYQKGRMDVEFDESLVSEEQILKAVERLGYHAEQCPG